MTWMLRDLRAGRALRQWLLSWAQLRKELAKQKRMNEILKKTVGYFSNPE